MIDNEWQSIKQALENPNFKWRTISGVAKETGLPPITIVNSLSQHVDYVIRSSIPSTNGEDLFTTREHYQEKSTLWDRIENIITNKVIK